MWRLPRAGTRARRPREATTQPCWLNRSVRDHTATPSSRRRVDGVSGDAWRRDGVRAPPRPAAAADDEARNHQRGVPRHTSDVGATPGVPRPRPTIAGHAAPPCSNFHRSSREPPPTRSECTQNRNQNHPRPRLVDTTSAKAANGAVEAILKSSSSSSFFTPSQHPQSPRSSPSGRPTPSRGDCRPGGNQRPRSSPDDLRRS